MQTTIKAGEYRANIAVKPNEKLVTFVNGVAIEILPLAAPEMAKLLSGESADIQSFPAYFTPIDIDGGIYIWPKSDKDRELYTCIRHEMVERVAKIIFHKFRRLYWDGPSDDSAWEKLRPERQKEFLDMAFSVISAMMVPTLSMKKLDESLAPRWEHRTTPPHLISLLGSHTGASYQDMLEEALR